MRVKKTLLRFVSPDTDHNKRLEAARGEGEDFTALSPTDQLTVLFVLSHDREAGIALAASQRLAEAGEDFVLKALASPLDAVILKDIFSRFRDRDNILSAIAINPGLDEGLARTLAREGREETLSAFEDNPSIYRRFPSLIDGLRENPLAGEHRVKVIISSAEGFVKEDEGEKNNSPQDSEEGEAHREPRNAYQAICNMTAGEKVKLAHTGDKTIRSILIKDKNRVVAMAVLKNPKLTEQEVVQTVSSTSVTEELIREIALSRHWMKSYNVKSAMVFNPHTPLAFSLKIVDHLRERELKQLAKSRNVPGALVNAAVRKLRLRKGT